MAMTSALRVSRRQNHRRIPSRPRPHHPGPFPLRLGPLTLLLGAAVIAGGVAVVAVAQRTVTPVSSPAAATGQLSIVSDVPGAQVSIDGQDRGVTPLEVAPRPRAARGAIHERRLERNDGRVHCATRA